jgi:PadR family transcriptional regulator
MVHQSLGLVQGTVDVLILRTLTRGALHGYAISQWIRERSGGALAVEDAALYQALHRLERKGWLAAEWGVSDSGRRARFYQITSGGRKQLQSDVAELKRYVRALFAVLAPS